MFLRWFWQASNQQIIKVSETEFVLRCSSKLCQHVAIATGIATLVNENKKHRKLYGC